MSIIYLDSCGDHYNTSQLTRKWEINTSTAAFIDVQGRTGNCIGIPTGHHIAKRLDHFGVTGFFDPIVIGGYFQFLAPGDQGRILVFWSHEHPTIFGSLEFRGGEVQLWGPGTDIDTNQGGDHVKLAVSSFSPLANRWYAIEYLHRTGFNGIWRVKIDNVVYMDKPSSFASVPRQQYIEIRGGNNGIKMDDLYCMDLSQVSAPSILHDRPISDEYGDVGWSIGVIRPNGAGEFLTHTPVPDLGLPHYQLLNQDPIPDDDTTRLEDSTLDNKETWEAENLPADPLLEVIIACQTVHCLNPTGEGSIFQHLINDKNSDEVVGNVYDPNPSLFENFGFLGYRFWSQCWNEGWETESPPGTPRIRVTEFNSSQFGLKTKESGSINRVTQSVIEVLFPFVIVVPEPPEIPIVELPTVQSHKYVKLWKIVRSDGEQFRFTDHNQTLVNPQDGLLYTPVQSWRTSAHSTESGLLPGQNEFSGALGTILQTEVWAGKFRGATVTEFLLDFVYPWAGALLKTVRILDIVTNDAEKWVGTLFGRQIVLQRPVGDVYSRTCRHILGDIKCQFPLDTLEVTGQSITTVNTDRNRSTFRISAIPVTTDAQGNDRNADGYWDFGTITWLTGANVGLIQEIRSFTITDKEFILSIPTPFTIIVGDTCDITPGCSKLLDICNAKFDNLPNFGGFPTIPGYDQSHQPLGTSTRIFTLGDFLDLIF